MAAAGRRLTACALFLMAASSSRAGSDDLPEAIAEELRAATFVAVKSVAGLPESARLGLARLFHRDPLELADPGAEFQATDVITKLGLPARRLGVAGCSPRYCIVYYERGGIAHTWTVVILQVLDSPAALAWGGSAPGGLADLDAVKQALRSGRVRARTGYW